MVAVTDDGCFMVGGNYLIEIGDSLDDDRLGAWCRERELPPLTRKTLNKEKARRGTIAYRILSEHNHSDDIDNLKTRFDSLVSHDITYVGIVQTARLSRWESLLLSALGSPDPTRRQIDGLSGGVNEHSS